MCVFTSKEQHVWVYLLMSTFVCLPVMVKIYVLLSIDDGVSVRGRVTCLCLPVRVNICVFTCKGQHVWIYLLGSTCLCLHVKVNMFGFTCEGQHVMVYL